MINFHHELDFKLENEAQYKKWLMRLCDSETYALGELNYIFCDDEYLHKINIEFLQHDTLTDIISFDYSLGKLIGGDIFISIERVEENAKEFKVTFQEELKRVLIHGVLHYMGYKDKTEGEKQIMRNKEDECLQSFSS